MENEELKQVYADFILPFDPHDYQVEEFEKACDDYKYLLALDVGLGKTFLGTLLALHSSIYKGVSTVMVLVPPSILYQWGEWFKKVKFADASPLDVLVYKGTPKQRKAMNYDHDIILMSHNIFRQDYKRLSVELGKRDDIYIIYDEAHTGLRKPVNKLWRYTRNFSLNKQLLLLTATPISNPMDTYGIVKLIDPGCYLNKNRFEIRHVSQTDFFGNVTHWKHLEEMSDNLYRYGSKLEADEVPGHQLPPILYDRVPYELTPKHKKLYDKLVKEEMLMNDNGELLDANNSMKLFHLLQQFVTSPDGYDFANVDATLMALLETLYYETDTKLVIYGNYKMTNSRVLAHFNKRGIKAVGAWGDFTRKQQDENIEAFKHDDSVRVCIGNPDSLGVGVDELQYVTNRTVFTEMPVVGRQFKQAVGRVRRQGQVHECSVKCLVAVGTIQASMYSSLMKKDDLVNQVVKNRNTIRELMMGRAA